MKIQQLIDEQMNALYDRTGINKKRRSEVESIVRKLIEALGSEIVGEDVSCARTTHLSDSSCCDYLGERNALKAEQRLKLKEILSNIK